MAGIAKPPIDNLGEEGIIEFVSATSIEGTFSKLLNGLTTEPNTWGALLMNTGASIIFKLNQKSNIWAIGAPYSDGGGPNGKSVNISQLINGEFALILMSATLTTNSWYKMFSNLEAGTYKVTLTSTRYVTWNEWYIETVEEPKNKAITLNQLKMSMETVGKKIDEVKTKAHIGDVLFEGKADTTSTVILTEDISKYAYCIIESSYNDSLIYNTIVFNSCYGKSMEINNSLSDTDRRIKFKIEGNNLTIEEIQNLQTQYIYGIDKVIGIY